MDIIIAAGDIPTLQIALKRYGITYSSLSKSNNRNIDNIIRSSTRSRFEGIGRMNRLGKVGKKRGAVVHHDLENMFRTMGSRLAGSDDLEQKQKTYCAVNAGGQQVRLFFQPFHNYTNGRLSHQPERHNSATALKIGTLGKQPNTGP